MKIYLLTAQRTLMPATVSPDRVTKILHLALWPQHQAGFGRYPIHLWCVTLERAPESNPFKREEV